MKNVSAETAEGARPLGIEQQPCGRTPPYLAPYFAAKAGMDAMAVVYARELVRWGVVTTIVVPRSRAAPTISPTPAALQTPQSGRVRSWTQQRLRRRRNEGLCLHRASRCGCLSSRRGDCEDRGHAIRKRPFRVHVDPTEDGAEVTNMVMDRVRAELLRRIGLGNLLQVSI